MKKEKKREQIIKHIKTKKSNTKYILILILSLGLILVTFLFSSMEPEEIEDISFKFSEFINIFYKLFKKAILKDPSTSQVSKTPSSFLNFACFNRGSSITNVSKEIVSASSLLKANFYSLLFPMKVIKQKPLEFVISGIEDFYLKEVIFKTNDFYTNFPKKIKIYTSINNTRRNWKYQGQVNLKDKPGFTTYKIKNISLCRFVKVVIVSCHDNFNFYYCSLNNLKLRGLTISEKKLEFLRKQGVGNVDECMSTSTFDYFSKKNKKCGFCGEYSLSEQFFGETSKRLLEMETKLEKNNQKIDLIFKEFENLIEKTADINDLRLKFKKLKKSVTSLT